MNKEFGNSHFWAAMLQNPLVLGKLITDLILRVCVPLIWSMKMRCLARRHMRGCYLHVMLHITITDLYI